MDGTRLYLDDEDRFAALRQRDESADGQFFFGVLTTGIYCYPSCSSRPALRQNILFYKTASEAERAGFRPCKRCQPERPPRACRERDLVVACCRKIEAEPDILKFDMLARWAGLSPYHFHRLFRRITGITPMVYTQSWRQLRLKASLSRGTKVTTSIYEAGFQSSARFYELATDMLGMKPSVYKMGAPTEVISYTLAPCRYGITLVANTAQGICAVFVGRDEKPLINSLHIQFPRAFLRQESGMKTHIIESIKSASLLAPVGLPEDIEIFIFQIHANRILRETKKSKQPASPDYSAAVS